MSKSNYPITSREYKLMLNTDRFKHRSDGCQSFLDLLVLLIKKAGGMIDQIQDEEQYRMTSYIDTRELALHQKGFALRIREEQDKRKDFQVNLKYRGSDRYISASQDLSCAPTGKIKFEEDILPQFVSKFSHSATLKLDSLPDFDNFGKVVSFFPGLKKLNIAETSPLKTVNEFKVMEVVRNLCKFDFGGPPNIKASLSFWYLTDAERNWPVVGEFSFDYDIKEDETKDDELESYPKYVVHGSNEVFESLHRQTNWINFNGGTKTAFAIERI